MNDPMQYAAPTLGKIYDSINSGLQNTSLVHSDLGVVYPEAPGFLELQRRLALELTKLTPLLFADNESQRTGLKYCIDEGEGTIRDIDSRFGPLAAMLDVPSSLIDGYTTRALPDPDADFADFVPERKRRLPASAQPPRVSTLELIGDNDQDWVPAAGQLCIIHTSAGFIPAGIVSGSADGDVGVKIHIYRSLLGSPTDSSFYGLVPRNELLMPPVIVSKTHFERRGPIRLVKGADAPRPVPFDAYYINAFAQFWDPEKRRFSNAYSGVTRFDGTVRIQPTKRDQISVTDENGVRLRALHEGEDLDEIAISGAMTVFPHVLTFALEDSLSYFGLIDTPRPDKARY